MTRARLSLILIVLAGALALVAGSALGAGAQRASSASPLVGIGDEQPAMFANPAFKALHTRIARYVTPYDVATNHSRNDLPRLKAWLAAAKKQGIQPLIAFYHSDRTARKMPSVKAYTSAVKRFHKAFPQVTLLQPWNEANRGNVRESGNGSYSSPSATQSAQYYLALKSVCPKCTIVGLDVLDSTNVPATIRYINVFKRYLGSKRLPSIWGLHNYSDTNRFHSTGTRAVLADTTGQLWLTETGGIVKLVGRLPVQPHAPDEGDQVHVLADRNLAPDHPPVRLPMDRRGHRAGALRRRPDGRARQAAPGLLRDLRARPAQAFLLGQDGEGLRSARPRSRPPRPLLCVGPTSSHRRSWGCRCASSSLMTRFA